MYGAIYESAKRNKINTMKLQLFIYDSAYVLLYESAKCFTETQAL